MFLPLLCLMLCTFTKSQNLDDFNSDLNNCVSFKVGSGTGCQWMCNYCAEKLNTNNYYFIDGVCKYKLAGCQGTPELGVEYTCCKADSKEDKTITVFLNNSNNSPLNNPPGFNLWVGGDERGDPDGIKVDKTDSHLAYSLPANTLFLLTWYYNWGWYSGLALQGPWEDGEDILLPKVSQSELVSNIVCFSI